MQSQGPGIQSFEAVNANFGYFGQHTSAMKKQYGYFWYHFRGKLQAQ